VRRVLATAVAAVALAGPASANAADCITYPGDQAPKQALAAWMSYGATSRGVPGELPVMAALVESNLTNLPPGASGYAGFFQMRVAIWDRPPYTGFATNPQLQLNWFVDSALAVLASKGATDSGYGASDARYGEWVADVVRPAEQFRGRYQPRLGEARTLIGAGCVPDAAPSPPPGGSSPPADSAAPALTLARGRPLARLRGVSIGVECTSESCTAAVAARIALPGAARVYRLRSAPRSLAPGERTRVTLRFGRKLRAALARRRSRGRHAAAQLTVLAVDGAGNRSSEQRRVRLF
jgi:hypothetical protein